MDNLCDIAECEKVKTRKNWCDMHYRRWYRTGSTDLPTKIEQICDVEDCERPKEKRQWCGLHYQRWRLHGDVNYTSRAAPSPDGKYITTNGYIRLTGYSDHPNSDKSGRIHEHVLVMEEKLGRYLLPGENVHHKNGNRADNTPDNLELWVVSQPAGQRPADLLEWAYLIIQRYGENNE